MAVDRYGVRFVGDDSTWWVNADNPSDAAIECAIAYWKKHGVEPGEVESITRIP